MALLKFRYIQYTPWYFWCVWCVHVEARERQVSIFFCPIPLRQGLSLNWKLTILTRLAAHHGSRICLFQLPSAGLLRMGQLSSAWLFMWLEVWTWVLVQHSKSTYHWVISSAPGCVVFLRQAVLVSSVGTNKCVLPYPAYMLISSNTSVFLYLAASSSYTW